MEEWQEVVPQATVGTKQTLEKGVKKSGKKLNVTRNTASLH